MEHFRTLSRLVHIGPNSKTRDRPSRRSRRSRVGGLLLLLVFAAPSAWLGSRQARLEIDSQNRALKSTDTRESHDVARFRASFGSDQSILLGFQTAPGMKMSAAEARHVSGIATAVAAIDGVRGVGPVTRPDEGLACLRVTLPEAGASGADTHAVAERVLSVARRLCSRVVTMRATGQPLFEAAIAADVDRERSNIVPWIVGVLILLLAIVYRSLLTAALILLPAGFGILWTGGLLQLLGFQLDPLLVLLDPLLLTVGIAVSVHLVEAYRRHRTVHDHARAAEAVRRQLWRPMLLTTITSMVGFLSLLLSPIPAVRSFGSFAAFGVALTSCFALWTVPVWLAAFAPDRLTERGRQSLVVHYVAWLHTSAARVLIVAAVVLAALLFHGSEVRIDNDPMKILAADAPLRVNTDWLASRIGGVETFGLLVPRYSAARAPDITAVLAAELSSQDIVAGLAGPPLQARNGDVLVQATLQRSGSDAREALFDRIEEFAADLGVPEVHAVGTAVQVARDSGTLIRSQLWGLLLVVPLLGVAVALGLRSWRLGLVSLVPNALPCLLLHGAMAALDRPLSVATVMIGSVMMGLIVDDTIHLLYGFRESVSRGHSRRNAVADSLRHTSRPITVTSLVLFLGFLVGSFGALTTTIEFSVLAAATIALAWVLDILILPAMLVAQPVLPAAEARSVPIRCTP